MLWRRCVATAFFCATVDRHSLPKAGVNTIGYSHIDSATTPSSIGDIEIHKSKVTRFHDDGASSDSGVRLDIYVHTPATPRPSWAGI